jgi:hypothetical protein
MPDADEGRWKRQAENERLLREYNWEVAEVTGRDAPDDEEMMFLCACGRPRCDERILLTAGEYRAAHARPHRFIVVPDHVTPHIERLVERHARYVVVEKLPSYQA